MQIPKNRATALLRKLFSFASVYLSKLFTLNILLGADSLCLV